jgi:hypothetical protein
MSERPPESGTKDVAKEDSTFLIRHSKASYKPYGAILQGEDPEQPMNYENQPDQDLNEEGVQLALREAPKFFDTLDPTKDTIFIVSSPERRAIETALIYRDIAKERGFEVIRPKHARSKLAEEIGGGEIRVLNALSTKLSQGRGGILVSTVFSPTTMSPENNINWDAVEPVTQENYARARQIIANDDRGSWSANFIAHSEQIISELFPGKFRTAQELFDTEFQDLLHLARFGAHKAEESGMKKNVKFLAFGHDFYICPMLEKYFGDSEINNCESIGIDVQEDGVMLHRRGNNYLIGRATTEST